MEQQYSDDPSGNIVHSWIFCQAQLNKLIQAYYFLSSSYKSSRYLRKKNTLTNRLKLKADHNKSRNQKKSLTPIFHLWLLFTKSKSAIILQIKSATLVAVADYSTSAAFLEQNSKLQDPKSIWDLDEKIQLKTQNPLYIAGERKRRWKRESRVFK